ncbi:DUF4097 family beta strand repeat-containing protein [Granulicella sp. dw_53]|uniref:DUF4097 family beta strand repeat-containing protein n=1 Tax=Granulicella sp. dw_53 TaxID=2719792 RepID=UPI001BD3A463|nr:DUF4097 family beta strand repeat-containing protein [Granulicella sp. dw_53]
MNTRNLLNVIAFPVALALSTNAFAAEATFDRTLNTGSSPTLSVGTGSGYIHLRPGSDSQIHIIGHVHSNNNGWMNGGHSDAESRVREIAAHPPIDQSGNTVTIGERHSNDLFHNISIDYDITLPRTTSLTANSGSGDIDIQEVGTNLKADSGSGNVRAHGIHGPANLQTGSGDIELQQTGPGDVRAQTGSGSVRLNGISGGLRAGTGSGDIEVDGRPTTDWKLETGSGSIHLNVGRSTAFTVNASTGSGGIHIEQPLSMQGDLNRHHIAASVNGGGPVIRAETGSGDIRIQ